nr:MAG TPA: Putative integron gene cassette protein [Caudoviricetes sp.]
MCRGFVLYSHSRGVENLFLHGIHPVSVNFLRP